MSKTTDLKTLQHELQEALSLITDYSTTHNVTGEAVLDLGELNNTQGLLERCAAVVNIDNANSKPILRVIHHFACSGGTLISKCIAAQPNVFLLSEMHPTTRLGLDFSNAQYTPRDVVTQAIYGHIPNIDSLAERIFVQNIIETEKHVRNLGGYLVIRAHSHSDYCTNQPVPVIDTITRLLSPHFNIKQLITIRNPIDSFLSLQENKWVHFNPGEFDEYCRRFIVFAKSFSKDEVVKYEDFVVNPDDTLLKVAKILFLPFKDCSLEYIDVFKISGGSGRQSVDIKVRKRKEISETYKESIFLSERFREISACFGYYF